MTDTTAAQPQWVEPFLRELREGGKINRAARAVGISRGTVNDRRKRHPDFDARCKAALVAAGSSALTKPRGSGGLPKWCKPFLEALAETSNVSASAKDAGTQPHRVYRLRRENAEFARLWSAALLEGYENLELETLERLRNGVAADGPKFDTAAALRLLALHRETAARKRAKLENCDEASVLASLNAKLDAMRRNEEALQAALAEDGTYRIAPPDGDLSDAE
ncbi:hypothetical protein P8R33_13920 [Qipengyuania sp. XHP0211]|uniref:hypothetical protein n=1 Tax=Qipengyuania sp. XHP0211 TaxID=3038079 RepID=UPI00241EBA27|nr:hypothetical protein [Qipengyuania sp. XHP0211]MDG5752207.1 hypothetical protein [Qipengyuania sp. XHP0211]